MSGSDFSRISGEYDRRGLVQKAASEKLFDELAISGGEDVLDLGCGTGALTKRIRVQTKGRVTGLDPSAGMIHTARESCAGLDIRFIAAKGEELSFAGEFDVIFCNSAFQWFKDPAPTLARCLKALRPGGRIGIQAPATSSYSPQMVEAVSKVAASPRTRNTFIGFENPWFFLEHTQAYERLFESAGFIINGCSIERTVTSNTAEEAMGVFESGAAAGYLNPTFYPGGFDVDYEEAFREIVMGHFVILAEAGGGRMELEFNRVYLLAGKPAASVRPSAGKTS
ncbi:MAG: methyltransferase domain-containing protein [Nitrospinota bacterium]|nr:methyltransferase domain-containing protein [Nitrospinota bacterium]